MTLHRKHRALNTPALGRMLSMRDQLALQDIILTNRKYNWALRTYWLRAAAISAREILERHGVSVSLDENTGRVTFDPEVVDA